jgi:hypothetical protein
MTHRSNGRRFAPPLIATALGGRECDAVHMSVLWVPHAP